MKGQRGMTLVEVLGVLVILGIAVGAVQMMRNRPLGNPISTGTNLLEGVLREARLNAISTMSAYRVSPASTNRLQGEKGATCSATTWTVDPAMNTTLPTGVTMSPTSWTVCYSSRGIATQNVTVTLAHSQYPSRSVEVLVGGVSRLLP